MSVMKFGTRDYNLHFSAYHIYIVTNIIKNDINLLFENKIECHLYVFCIYYTMLYKTNPRTDL